MGRVAVIHPDLGIGGAERLIVDASKALQERGHQVKIYTGYHDETRCFEETRDGTLEVFTVGSWLPRTIFGKCHALMAYTKMIYIAIYLIIFSRQDLILCDQVSACVPFFRLCWWNKLRIIFYCHFPDQLLTTRDTLIKSIYRKPVDYLEERSMHSVDVILVNSLFTRSVVTKTFKSLKDRQLKVLYPCVDVHKYDNCQPSIRDCSQQIRKLRNDTQDKFLFMSLNRFERKKNLSLAILALKQCLGSKEQGGMRPHLIVAGGYDDRLSESVQYYDELAQLVNILNLNDQVTFIKSPNDNEKSLLLKITHTIIYTSENEHFGIVPLEAMAMSKPVIACASGGPCETIEQDVTGFLCEANKESFAESMIKLMSDKSLCDKMGRAGKERVKQKFSYQVFSHMLNEICYS